MIPERHNPNDVNPRIGTLFDVSVWLWLQIPIVALLSSPAPKNETQAQTTDYLSILVLWEALMLYYFFLLRKHSNHQAYVFNNPNIEQERPIARLASFTRFTMMTFFLSFPLMHNIENSYTAALFRNVAINQRTYTAILAAGIWLPAIVVPFKKTFIAKINELIGHNPVDFLNNHGLFARRNRHPRINRINQQAEPFRMPPP